MKNQFRFEINNSCVEQLRNNARDQAIAKTCVLSLDLDHVRSQPDSHSFQ